MRSLGHIAALFAVLLPAGCGTFLDGPPPNRCEGDGDCSAGSCDVLRGMCVASPATPLAITVEVVPASDPYGGMPLPVAFALEDEVTGPSDLGDLVLPVNVLVRGQVRWIGEPVSASITFTLLSQVPGASTTRVETQTFAEPMRDPADGSVFDYAVQLLPSQTYEVTVQPNGEWRSRLPPLRARFETVDRGVARDFPYEERLSLVTGAVVDTEGEPQTGMIVRAIEPVTGRVVSSTYTTGTDPEKPPGYFELRLAPGIDPTWLFSLNASGARLEEGRPSPTFSVDPSALLEGPEGVTILVPPVSTQVITYRGLVEVAGRPGQGASASLSFTARSVLDDVTQVVGSFRAMVATSDEPGHEGELTVQLLPGTYDVVITPSSVEHGVIREEVALAASAGGELSGQLFQVPLRARYQGTVRTPAGEPVLNAQVRGRARGSTFGDVLPSVAVYARSSDAVADPNGLFALPLDVGLYDVVVEPPAGTSWPWALARDVAVGASATDIPGNAFELTPPVPVGGRAVFAGDLPVVGGEVRAYALVPDGAGTRAVQVARTQTDDLGRFTLLLPPAP